MPVKIIFLLLINIAAYGQPKSTSIMNNTYFMNEYWSWSEGPYFKNYYLSDKGTFSYNNGYSGGIYSGVTFEGKYTFSPSKKEIKLHVKNEVKGKIKIPALDKQMPDKIAVKSLSDRTVTISFGKDSLNIIKMNRLVGVTTDQYWHQGSTSSHNVIRFTLFGQATIVQETDVRRVYVCSYHINGNLLLLEVSNMITGNDADEKQTKFFTPSIKTFLKVQIGKKIIKMEKADLHKIIDGTRNWKLHNMKFHLENNDSGDDITEYEEYNRVR